MCFVFYSWSTPGHARLLESWPTCVFGVASTVTKPGAVSPRQFNYAVQLLVSCFLIGCKVLVISKFNQ